MKMVAKMGLCRGERVKKMRPIYLGLVCGSVVALAVACDSWTTGSQTQECVGPYCDVECTADTGCPLGSWCEAGQCTTEVTGGCDDDPDGDGYCECCDLGQDCGEGNAAVHPGADELCDGIDNDCDGATDRSACEVDTQGSGGGTPFDDTGTAGGIVENPDGSLTLGSTDVATDFAWPSNDAEGTISRIDTILNVEVGRYATVLRIAGANPNDPGATPNVNEWDSGCNRPSRTTVDLTGNAYVANRAHQGGCAASQGHITKIGFYDKDLCDLSLASCQCKDRNGNGTIETSQDLDGDGSISLSAPEYLAYDDECLLWTVPVGASNSNARAMAIDAYGFIWVGDWQGERFFKLNPEDGSLVNPIDSTQPATGNGLAVDGQPYGAVVDSVGNLWYVNTFNTGQIQRVDTRTGAIDTLNTDNPTGGYGITIDRKDRVWMASWQDLEGGGTVTRFDPSTSTWATFSGGLGGTMTGRGITATPAGKTDTGAGIVWAVFHASGEAHLVGFDDDTGEVWDSVDLGAECGAITCIGAGLGTGDSVWVVNQGSDNVCRYDSASGAVSELPIGNAPYTYSDFTGNVLRNFTAPQGTYRLLLEGCPGGEPRVAWSVVMWDAATPGGSRIEVRVRTANTIAGLASATLIGPATQPPDRQFVLTDVNGDFIEVTVMLIADANGNVPTLLSLTVGRECSEDPQ